MKRQPLFILTGALALVGILTVEFAASDSGRNEVSLYQRIGGLSGATTIVEGFLAGIGDDDRLVVRFAEADMDGLRGPLSDLLCEATGGPCWYEGDGMLDVRRRPGVTEEVFGIMARHFAAAMIDAGIGTYDQFAAMEAYLAMHDTIVRNGPRYPVDAPGGYFQVSGG